MNSINILSPKIGFPILYLLLNVIPMNTISYRVLASLLIFYMAYYVGIFSFQYMVREHSINKLGFEKIFYFPQNARIYKLAKTCVWVYCATIVIQFLRVGIGHTDTFRMNWLDSIPMGQYLMLPIAIGAHIYIYMLTLEYIRGQKDKTSFIVIILLIYATISLIGSRTVFTVFFFIQFSILYLCRKITTRQTLCLSGVGILSMIILRIVTLLYGKESTLQFYLDKKLIDYDSPWQTLMNFTSRSLLDMAHRTQKVIDNVPEIINHTYGKSLFFTYYSILPDEQMNPTVMLNHDLFHGSAENVGYPPTIMAQIYMDFGFLGVLLVPMIIGYLYAYVFYKARATGSFFHIYIYIALTYSLFLSCYGEFLTFSIFMFILLYYFGKFFLCKS